MHKTIYISGFRKWLIDLAVFLRFCFAAMKHFGFIKGLRCLRKYLIDNNNLFQKNIWVQDNYIGLKLSVPIFDGLSKFAQMQQQKLAMQKNENNLNNLRQTVNYQLQTTSVNYANAYENLKLIQQNVKLAEDIIADVNVRYQNSLATYQEVVDAENTLKDTEFTYLQAMYTYLLAELDWKKANGKL